MKYAWQATCGALLFFVISAAAPRLQDRLLTALSLAALLSSLIGILQFFGVTFVYGFHHYFGDLQLGAVIRTGILVCPKQARIPVLPH